MKHLLRHLFIPHESNHHRSKLLHYDSLVLIIAVLFSGLIVMQGMHREYPAVLGDATSITVDDLLQDTNLKREANGLAPLKLNAELSDAAKHKADDMFAKNYWAHVSPDGTTPWVFIKSAGYEYMYAGENLARGFDSSQAVVNAWMASPTHRENLLSPHYTDIGFAIEAGTLTGTETTLVVQEFGSPYYGNDSNDNQQALIRPPTPMPTVYQTANAAQPTPASSAVGSVQSKPPQSTTQIKDVQNQPLVDASSLKRNISFFFLALFIIVLALDALYIERKQIVRVFSHNIDHMLFLLFILLAGILIGRGLIL